MSSGLTYKISQLRSTSLRVLALYHHHVFLHAVHRRGAPSCPHVLQSSVLAFTCQMRLRMCVAAKSLSGGR